MARTWRCQKVSKGVRCGTDNPRVKQRCQTCGGPRPATRKPAHLAALDAPYEEWVALYGERCGICNRPPKPGRKLHRDHDHRSGKPRELLCFPCNAALRTYMDLEWMRAAVAYLERAEENGRAAA
jgi:hypothetical protein